MSSTMSTEDTTYNGWKNYPTWCVNLWLSNEEPLYLEALARTREILEDKHPSTDVWTVDESRRFNTADMLKSWVRDELAPDLGASFGEDLLGYALDQVDWHEIADSWIEQASDAD
jgi:hypothetical protein